MGAMLVTRAAVVNQHKKSAAFAAPDLQDDEAR